jgi:tetratricopeptide (TPR) repeat protein
MRRLLVGVMFLGALTQRAAAQDSTAAVLQRGRDLYERLELERALPLFREVISPGWTFDVSAAQRVEAHLYLGAALMLLDARDSAVAHFQAALERDPFTDLDASRFTPSQLDAFQAARRGVFAVGVRPVAPVRLDPRTERMTFTIVATHAASVRCEIRLRDSSQGLPLFTGDIQGLRQIDWDGVLPSGQLTPSGRYVFVLLARSRILERTDSGSASFDVHQEFPALEDTLGDFQARDLLPERYPNSGADLLKGLGVAAGALFLSEVASNRDLGRSHAMPIVIATAGLGVGVTSFLSRRGHIRPENVAVNDRRRAERSATNEQIRRRNAARLAQTVLLITPAAGRAP